MPFLNKNVLPFLFVITLTGCQKNKTITQDSYPVIKSDSVVESHFGTQITDRYRNLENFDEAEIATWYQNQDDLTESYFEANKYDDLKNQYIQLYSRGTSYVHNQIIAENGYIFYMDWNFDINGYSLYYKKNFESDAIFLFSPKAFEDGSLSIKYIKPSYNSKFVAIAVGLEGDLGSRILVLETEIKKIVSKPCTNAAPDFIDGINWLPDNNKFVYLFFPNLESDKKPIKENSYSVVYDLKTGKSEKLFGNTEKIIVPKNYYPVVGIHSSFDMYLIAYISHADRYWDTYILPLDSFNKGEYKWRKIFSEEDNVLNDYGRLQGSSYIFLKNMDESTNICKVDLNAFQIDKPTIIARSSSEKQIRHFEILKDKLIFTRIKNGTQAFLYEILNDGRESEIKLPYQAGTIKIDNQSINSNNLWATIDGWTKSSTRFSVNSANELSKIQFGASTSYVEFDDIISEQIELESHDGQLVPLTILRKENIQYNSKNKTLIEAYGAYGFMLEPYFSPMHLDWIKNGGVLAYAHVRGGGEKGVKWHEDGRKEKKSNSWKDLLACANYLINQKITNPKKLGLFASSAGGITAGMALNTNPELFSAFVATSPRLNPVRLEFSKSTSSSFMEYGSIENKDEADFLIKMDPYLNLSSENNYPPTLVISGFKDDRIPISDAGKYIARIQSFKNSKHPVLLDINFDDGHSGNDDVEQYAKVFTFLNAVLE